MPGPAQCAYAAELARTNLGSLLKPLGKTLLLTGPACQSNPGESHRPISSLHPLLTNAAAVDDRGGSVLLMGSGKFALQEPGQTLAASVFLPRR